jgi:hypothetical protein
MRVKIALMTLVLASGFVPSLGQTKPAEGRAQATTDQRKTASDKDDVVRISVTLVPVDSVVTDRRGKLVTDLEKEDFEIYEDGKRQLNYSLIQLLITDPLAKAKYGTATQWADFEIIK